MHQVFRSVCPVETRILPWLIALTFLVIVSFQYFEFPYDSFNSLLSAGKVSINGFSSANISQTDSSSSIVSDAVHDLAKDSETLNITHVENGFESVKNESLKSDAVDGNSPISSDDKVNTTFTLRNIGSPAADLNVTSLSDEGSKPEDEKSNEQNESSIIDNGTKSISQKNDTIDDHFSLNNDEKEIRTSSSADGTRLSNDESDKRTDNSTLRNEEKSRETKRSFQKSDGKENLTQENIGSPFAAFPPSFPAVPPIDSSTEIIKNVDSNKNSPQISVAPNISPPTSSVSNQSGEVEKSHDSISSVPEVRRKPVMQTPGVATISDMNRLLHHNRAMHHSKKPRWSSATYGELLYARSQIENAPIVENDPELYAPLYHNVSTFKRSYELMEKTLKVYIYKEGKKPIFHHPVLKGIYAAEGWFMKLLQASRTFLTKDGKKAHLFYLPFSSRMLEETLYVANSHSRDNLIQHLKDYLDLIGAKYPFWNRTDGADHFLVACHDWAPAETKTYMNKCIRALCNADVKESYVFGKDVSLPETMVRNAQNPLKFLGGKTLSERKTLAFFAGKMHGYLRPILLQHWGGGKDPDMKISDKLPKTKGSKSNYYIQSMKTSKYCICPRGYEVNSPRIVEAIFFECVPVIISDNFVPPFFEILNWESFAVFVAEKDVPNLKKILVSIPERRYLQMQLRVKKIQKHFLWHTKPVKYDIFHMILHSIWYKRVFQI